MSGKRQRLLTFGSGGWVIALALAICLAIISWALAPAVLRLWERPPGNGVDIESYGFDLANLQVSRELVFPAMLHRDMVTPIDEPVILAADEVNVGHGKYVVSSDRVIGVTINGESRAYPISTMNVHEIVHDELGGRPIVVTYHWPCDTAIVFDREVDGKALTFGISGLLYNANMLMYDRHVAESDTGNPAASLWSQMLGRAVSGPAADAGLRLNVVPSQVIGWEKWRERHPETTVVGRDPTLVPKRYKKADPDSYYRKGKIIYPVAPLPPDNGVPALAPVLAVELNGERRVYPLSLIEMHCGVKTWNDTLGGSTIAFTYDKASETAMLSSESDVTPAVTSARWFAWHAFHPDDPLAR